MNTYARTLVGLTLAASALALAHEFVTYDARPERLVPGTYDISATIEGELIYLGDTSLPPPPNSDLARFGGRIHAERGIFAKGDHSTISATIFGIVIPILVLMTATGILFGRPRIRL